MKTVSVYVVMYSDMSMCNKSVQTKEFVNIQCKSAEKKEQEAFAHV